MNQEKNSETNGDNVQQAAYRAERVPLRFLHLAVYSVTAQMQYLLRRVSLSHTAVSLVISQFSAASMILVNAITAGLSA